MTEKRAPITVVKNILIYKKVSMKSASSMRDFLKTELQRYYEKVELVEGGHLICISPKISGDTICRDNLILKCIGKVYPKVIEDFYSYSQQIKMNRNLYGINRVLLATQSISNDAVQSMYQRGIQGLRPSSEGKWIFEGRNNEEMKGGKTE
jgi:hypothetical protein